MTGLADLIGTEQQVVAAFTYLFRGMDNQRFRAYFDNGIKAKARIDRSGYILLNCKLYAWASWVGRQHGVTKLSPERFGVSKEDARLLRKLDLGFVGNWPAYRLTSFQRLVAQELFNSEMNSYIGKFITKKMTFLIKSYGVTRQDIENDLRTAALYHVYRAYPYFESPLHLRNVGKTALKRAGQDLIQYHTHPSRQKLRGPDFEHAHVPLAMLESVPAEQSSFDVDRALQALAPVYEQYGSRGKHFLDLLSGGADPHFSDFLGKPNEIVYETIPFEEYMQKVQSHLQITDRQREAFFRKLRKRTGIGHG